MFNKTNYKNYKNYPENNNEIFRIGVDGGNAAIMEIIVENEKGILCNFGYDKVKTMLETLDIKYWHDPSNFHMREFKTFLSNADLIRIKLIM